MSQNVTIDDRDPILHYSGGWFREGTFNATSVGETGTLASSDITSGVNVTFVFPSPATEFFYYGMQRCCGSLYLICVDCDPNNRQFETINAVNPTDNGQNPPVVLFSRKFDVPATHEVILMNSPDSAFGGNSQITLDRFVLTVPDPAQTGAVVPFPTSSSTTTSSLSGSSSSSIPSYLVPMLAGILGGLGILFILVGIWLLVRRQRRSRQLRGFYNPEEAFGSPSRSQSLWRSAAETLATVPATAVTVPRRETDAGRVQNSETDISPVETLPPDYGQVFDPAVRPPPPFSLASLDNYFPRKPRRQGSSDNAYI